jgi:hypothetical protein
VSPSSTFAFHEAPTNSNLRAEGRHHIRHAAEPQPLPDGVLSCETVFDTDPPAIDIESGWPQHDLHLSYPDVAQVQSHISDLTKTINALNQVVRLPLDPSCVRCPGRGVDYSNLPAPTDQTKRCPTCGPPFKKYDPPELLIGKFLCTFECGKRYICEFLAKPMGYGVCEASTEWQGMHTPHL